MSTKAFLNDKLRDAEQRIQNLELKAQNLEGQLALERDLSSARLSIVEGNAWREDYLRKENLRLTEELRELKKRLQASKQENEVLSGQVRILAPQLEESTQR
jgi:chromosome segregation ATPase